jgi:uncharacterized protein YndB with AHSA1/START domain
MSEQKDLVITRTFNAPQSLVWQAWSQPEHFKKWWGPKEFTCPDAEIDFRVGGKFLASMMDDKGKKIWSTGTYKEIDPKTKIIFSDCFANEKGDIVSGEEYGMKGMPMEMEVTVMLKEDGGKTEMTIIHKGIPAGEHQQGANVGWNSSIDKMQEMVEAKS